MRLVICIHRKESFIMEEREHYYMCRGCGKFIGKKTAHSKSKATWERNWRNWWIQVED